MQLAFITITRKRKNAKSPRAGFRAVVVNESVHLQITTHMVIVSEMKQLLTRIEDDKKSTITEAKEILKAN